MTVEQLMQQRILVANDWPGRRDFEVGQIITLDKVFGNGSSMMEITDCQGTRTYVKEFFEMFPLHFRFLEWWEERDEKDMPGYVKDEYGVYKVMNNWYDLDSDGCCSAHTFRDNKFYAKHVLPATEQEYNDYINQFK
ncbi:MAG TPA: hypothetical protein PKV73_01295 [Agriterribacter sp.]|nr:hypothetical protein [Agriterribacter sp.]